MKKVISCVLSLSMMCSSFAGLTLSVKAEGSVVFKHQNVVGSQTCYADDTAEKTITEIPNVIQGIRINQPVFRAEGLTANKSYTVKQELKDGTVIREETVTASDRGVLEFKHVRNCEMIEILDGSAVVASLGEGKQYTRGVMITYAPMSWQVFQRDGNNKATITIKGETETGSEVVSVDVDGSPENVTVNDKKFTYTKELAAGHHTITVKSGSDVVAVYENVAVGDVWVAAGQSNMTDMGRVTENSFDRDTDDPINNDMHIIYAEDVTWHKMSHPAGKGRFFKNETSDGVRTSPVTTFAREIAASENVPVGIVQSSVGGTNIWQWVDGVRNADGSGYLIKALKSCFDKMPSHDVKGILWYQGCNDTISDNYAYNYKNLQQKVFDEMHSFFGADTPIITTQLNDANQDNASTSGYGWYDAWSFVKDIQRQNEHLYTNVYVVGTGEQELGDTIHNNAASNVKLGKKWAKAAQNVAYGKNVEFRQPTIDTAKVTGDKEITLTFKNTSGLKAATGTKRLDISRGAVSITLGDLAKEFTVRKGASKTVTASNSGKGTEMTIASASIQDNNKVVITTEEDLAGVIAVDCMYGRRFAPTLVDASTDESVLSFFNVIAEYEGAAEITPAVEKTATDTTYFKEDDKNASREKMYVNKYIGQNAMALMKFDLTGVDLSAIASAKLAVYATDIDKDRGGDITISEIKTSGWDNTSVYGTPTYDSIKIKDIKTVSGQTTASFPVNNYSSVDISDYLRAFTGNSIGIGMSSGYASVLTLAGVNSDNPPKLIIQPGKKVELTYTCDSQPCADMEVTVEAVGATEYTTTKFTTDENGKLTLYLTEGSYKATTEKEIGERNASSNTFTVSDSNITKTYVLEKNTEDKPAPPENPTYTFGDSYTRIKDFDTSALLETKIGKTGITASTTTSNNYNNVVVRDKSSTNSGYYPYGSGLPENGYYLFIGAGNANDSVSANLKLPYPVSAGKYIKITYAKPYSTNNGNQNCNTRNDYTGINTMTVGTETVDIEKTCEFDKWYTTTIKVSEELSSLSFKLGKWASVAISEIEVTDSADVLELTAEDNVTEKYITQSNQTLQYNATVYNSITTRMDSDTIIARGEADTEAKVEYSVNGYNGVSISESGLLTITSAAQAGDVTVSARYGEITKNAALTLKALGNATAVQIYGDEVIVAGASAVTKNYTAIPVADGTAFPARDTKWEIAGEAHGVSIANDGTLTVPANAEACVVTVKATLNASGVQTSEVSDSFPVTIRTSESKTAPYIIRGLLLKNGETDLTKAKGVDGIIIEKTGNDDGYEMVVKVFDESNLLVASDTVSLAELSDGVQSVDVDLEFKKAAGTKIYIKEKAADEEYQTTDNDYDIVKAEKNGSKLVRVVVMQNKKETDTSAKLIVAQYKNNALVTAAAKSVTLKKGENNIGISDVALGDGNNVKVLLWDDLAASEGRGMTPLAAPLTEISRAGSAGEVAVDEVTAVTTGEYKNVPLVSDWYTGEVSGLGMGKAVIAPQGVPYGVDPELVDVSTLNVSYTYDEDTYPEITTDNMLWYKKGANLAKSGSNTNSIYDFHSVDWERQALPIGNGYMGAMLFGLPDKDQIQLNEETFWAAGYRGVQTSVTPSYVNKNMSEGINGYMSVGNLFVDFNMPKNAQIKNYYRDLNLDESVAHVQYEYNGTKFSREYFASYPKEVVAIRYTADTANALSFDVNPVSMHPGEVTVNDGEITIVGKLKDSEPYDAGGKVKWSQESDLEYCTKIKVIAEGGTVTDGYNTVNVNGANAVTILVAAATDYDPDQFELNDDGTVNMEKTPYKSTQGVKAAIDKAAARMDGAADMSYAELKSEHIADYKQQFDKVKFSLTDSGEVCQTPTDELQSSYNKVIKADSSTKAVTYDNDAYNALNKHLEELHYNYARYMMISSSRSKTMPATLQGKWNQSTAEIWGSCYCININLEMNYWFAGGANLLDSGMSLVKWFNSQIPAGRVTAKNMYNVTPKSYKYENGEIKFTDSSEDKDKTFIMHTKQAIMGTTDLTGDLSIQSPGNTAWLMYNIWDLYQTSGDKELLAKDLYPIMLEAANFYTQYLYLNERKTTDDTEKYPAGYYYTTWEGRSPEQGTRSEGIKYDLQLVAGMYDYTIAAAEILGVDEDKVAAWKEIRNHLELPIELGEDGEIKEWKQEVRYNTDADGNAIGDPNHRHISHLVGLYPGTLINRDTGAWLNGAKIVLQNRGDDSTGWSCSNKFLLWARALEGDQALKLFRFQLAQKTYANLFDFHDPFQIDGNFGSAAGVMELLMQSQTGPVYILPALPTVWNKGEISGIKAKNGAEVSIKWSDGKATEIKIKPAADGDLVIGYDKDNTFTLNGSDITFTEGKYTIQSAVKGTEYIFTSK